MHVFRTSEKWLGTKTATTQLGSAPNGFEKLVLYLLSKKLVWALARSPPSLALHRSAQHRNSWYYMFHVKSWFRLSHARSSVRPHERKPSNEIKCIKIWFMTDRKIYRETANESHSFFSRNSWISD
jgi:hypothetical protein